VQLIANLKPLTDQILANRIDNEGTIADDQLNATDGSVLRPVSHTNGDTVGAGRFEQPKKILYRIGNVFFTPPDKEVGWRSTEHLVGK
jgi:hypothetical protein